jgi:hypothetical protein
MHKLLKVGVVEQLLNEQLACSVLCNPNALQHYTPCQFHTSIPLNNTGG